MTAIFRMPDVRDLAQAVLAAVRGGDDEERAAFICVALNRRKVALRHMAVSGRPHAEFGDGSLMAACRSVFPGTANFAAIMPAEERTATDRDELLQTAALACLLMSGDRADPTGGAVYFHRHDVWPAWAERRTPTALIGNHLFYPPE